MRFIACENCGCRVYNGLCVSCDEECFIEEQYLMDGESPPVVIADAATEQRRVRDQKRLQEIP